MSWETLQNNLPAGTIQEKKSFGPDERFWKLARNEKDTGTAIIRLILDKDNMPFVKMFSHSIKKYDPALGKDRYYIEDSPSSIGQPCPASEKWQELMKIGTPEAKKEAELLKRKVKFITNIYVVKDPLNPQNEGKVFLWEFGYKLNDKFLGAMSPSKEDIELGTKPKELYDPIEGIVLCLKLKNQVVSLIMMILLLWSHQVFVLKMNGQRFRHKHILYQNFNHLNILVLMMSLKSS
jgi:hypothetical protein